jgi:hypothetical protein
MSFPGSFQKLFPMASALALATPLDNNSSNGNSTSDFLSGATIAVMNLLNLNSSSQWVLANATDIGASISLLGIALEAKAAAGSTIKVALPGSIVKSNSWAWTPGALLFASVTPGAITATAPSSTDQVIRVIGYAMTATTIFFYPEPGYMTHV